MVTYSAVIIINAIYPNGQAVRIAVAVVVNVCSMFSVWHLHMWGVCDKRHIKNAFRFDQKNVNVLGSPPRDDCHFSKSVKKSHGCKRCNPFVIVICLVFIVSSHPSIEFTPIFFFSSIISYRSWKLLHLRWRKILKTLFVHSPLWKESINWMSVYLSGIPS